MELTPKSLEVINLSKQKAAASRKKTFCLHHVFFSILEVDSGICVEAITTHMKGRPANLEKVYSELNSSTASGDAVVADGEEELVEQSIMVTKAIHNARQHAKTEGINFISVEHMLAGILSQKNSSLLKCLSSHGFDPNSGLEFLLSKFDDDDEDEDEGNHENPMSNNSPKMVPVGGGGPKELDSGFLKKFGKNLNLLAKEKKLSKVFNRDAEITRLVSTLLRKNKSSAVLVGEAGVGKTAVVEGLAYQIQEGKVPRLKDRVIYEIDVGRMLAGTKYRGQFEERLKGVIQEATQRDDVILFIDEIHTIIGAGSPEGTLDAANIMKPALARGDISCIGATTVNEYVSYIEKDAALERRFQKISIDEPSRDTCIEILKKAKGEYESFHNVILSDEVVEKCVDYSIQYIQDRFLPDKAFDILDEVSVAAKIKSSDVFAREYEEELSRISKKKKELFDKQRMEELRELKEKEEAFKRVGPPIEADGSISVSVLDVAEVASSMSKIPTDVILETGTINVDRIRSDLKSRVVGHSEAIEKVIKSLVKSKTFFKNKKSPIASFLFAGPTGVGKTFLAKELARTYFGSEKSFIRFDMSEFQTSESVSKLIGAPAGYVGYESGGMLVTAIRKNPYSVILLDEIEKAHESVRQVIMQIIEEGYLVDHLGKVGNFNNCVLIMTANCDEVGANTLGFGSDAGEIRIAVERKMTKEFLTRLQVVEFFNLSNAEIKEVIGKECGAFMKSLSEKFKNTSCDASVVEMFHGLASKNNWNAREAAKNVSSELEDRVISYLSTGAAIDSISLFAKNQLLEIE